MTMSSGPSMSSELEMTYGMRMKMFEVLSAVWHIARILVTGMILLMPVVAVKLIKAARNELAIRKSSASIDSELGKTPRKDAGT